MKHNGEFKKENLKKYQNSNNGMTSSDEDQANVNLQEPKRTNGDYQTPLKTTLSQAMMNSNLLNSLPKYIFQTDHSRLTSVNNIIKDIKEQQQQSHETVVDLANGGCEVSEYPIEFIENQAHAINRHISIK